ncbi:MAG TPA: hypothetical protein PLD37_14520, partial [Usitatibacteraceae bacterium]|nr:hypothetical protein [Usitatibacteraceae bacterium]
MNADITPMNADRPLSVGNAPLRRSRKSSSVGYAPLRRSRMSSIPEASTTFASESSAFIGVISAFI